MRSVGVEAGPVTLLVWFGAAAQSQTKRGHPTDWASYFFPASERRRTRAIFILSVLSRRPLHLSKLLPVGQPQISGHTMNPSYLPPAFR
jgi:hypothetical protein